MNVEIDTKCGFSEMLNPDAKRLLEVFEEEYGGKGYITFAEMLNWACVASSRDRLIRMGAKVAAAKYKSNRGQGPVARAFLQNGIPLTEEHADVFWLTGVKRLLQVSGLNSYGKRVKGTNTWVPTEKWAIRMEKKANKGRAKACKA